jgi:P27 family predicted phage terminase small subunit
MELINKPSDPPEGLKDAGKKLWHDILTDYEIIDMHELERLEAACVNKDLIVEARASLARDGLFLPTRYGGVKQHPALKVLRDSQALLLRALRELGLDELAVSESRPPKAY